MTEAVYRVCGDVRYRVVDGEAVILRQTDGEVVVLNRVGSRCLELIDGERSTEGMVDRMLAEFEIDRDSLARDIEEFVEELRGARVIEEVDSQTKTEAR